MRVAFFVNTPIGYGGGTDKFFLEATRGLKQKYPQLDLAIITFDEIYHARLSWLLSIYYLRNLTSLNNRTEPDLKNIRNIECHSLTELRKELSGYDLIYSRNELLDLLILIFATWGLSTPVIIGIHTPVFYPFIASLQSKIHNKLYLSFFYHWLLSKAKALHVLNENDLDRLSKSFKKRIYLIRLPVKPEKGKEKNNQTKGFHCLFVGRLSEQKGVDILLKSIELLSQDQCFKNLKFKIAGKGDPKLVDAVIACAFNYINVQYLRYVPNDQMWKLYDWADVVLLPSRYETGSYVAIEAAHRNCVVLASNIPGPRQIIDNGKTGFLLELDSLKFAEKIRELYSLKQKSPEIFLKFGKQAELYVSKKLDPKLTFKKIYTMFKDTSCSI